MPKNQRSANSTTFFSSLLEHFVGNDPRPVGAVHDTNPHILKSIPRVCAMLAKYAGFDIVDSEQLDNFDIDEFVRGKTENALRNLRAQNVRPTMSAEELMRLTRER